jgi:hypothetical protein
LVFDEAAVLFGAATHDIGKALAPSELSQPGKTHELLGEDLLLRHGVPPTLARFARTHGLPVDDDSLTNDDLLVILSDTVWKGRRDGPLEDVITKALTRSGTPAWRAFDRLDAILTKVVDDADERLEWQGRHKATTGGQKS